jgi:hypothetical protein
MACFLIISNTVTVFRPKNLAAFARLPRRFSRASSDGLKIDLESAAFLFHMSGMQPESSGQRELRVP